MTTNTDSSVKAEPAQTATDNVKKTEPVPISVPSEKTSETNTPNTDNTVNSNDNATQSGTADAANTKVDGDKPSTPTESAKKPSRPLPTFDPATEDHIREIMSQARKVANGGESAFKTEDDVHDLALLTNNLVQLLNAAWVATDSIVRGVAYMQGGSNPHPKLALRLAKQDRRAQMSQKLAEEGLGDATKRAPTEINHKDGTQTANPVDGAHAEAKSTSDKENIAPATNGQDEKSQVSHDKSKKKKKGYWASRRDRKRKDSTHGKAQSTKVEDKAETKANGVVETKDIAEEKVAVKELKPEASGSDTAVEETGEGQGVVKV